MHSTTAHTVQKSTRTAELVAVTFSVSCSLQVQSLRISGSIAYYRRYQNVEQGSADRSSQSSQIAFLANVGSAKDCGIPRRLLSKQRGSIVPERTDHLCNRTKEARPTTHPWQSDRLRVNEDPSHNPEYDSGRAVQLHEVLRFVSVHEGFVDGH